jgi:hypothetical protein
MERQIRDQQIVIDNLRQSLLVEKNKSNSLQQNVFAAQQRVHDADLLLETCTAQNINAVLNLSKQNDDLM